MRKTVLALVVVFSFGLSQGLAQEQGDQSAVGADVQVKAAIAKAKSLSAPPANANKKATIGKGKASVNTANAAGDDDSFWVEEIDLDGDGTAEEADMLYDDEDKVLYLYNDGDFKCKGGGEGEGSLLVLVNVAGNSHKKPAGSGWYAVELDESECKAKAAGLFGCKFDANGNATACGLVTVDEKNDDIEIVEAAD